MGGNRVQGCSESKDGTQVAIMFCRTMPGNFLFLSCHKNVIGKNDMCESDEERLHQGIFKIRTQMVLVGRLFLGMAFTVLRS